MTAATKAVSECPLVCDWDQVPDDNPTRNSYGRILFDSVPN